MTDQLSALTKDHIDANPIRQFQTWLDEVRASGVSEQDAISMTLGTAGKDGQPSARIVLLKSFDDRGFVFYTNYHSRKGKELNDNPRACLLFYWPQLWRQVRIEGGIEKVSTMESEAYFQSRPLGSRLGAWASNQSEVVDSREVLEARFAELEKRFGNDVPRPEHWGGYRLKPGSIEFWQGRDNRLHDRLLYRLQEDGSWSIERLGP
ncbi:MAG: pyridoxamine 5-phosphate oxidase [Blastocatellia bacterium]|jgi:pyridoxamine 5'-phosphate oxidase|nr:pyridoxamine 5-phosphate oxidase [Blastocatellia bacterium]